MFSDDSDEEYDENDFYHKKYRLLLEKCEVIQQNNEMLVHRLQRMKKILHRIRKQRLFLMNWLDRHHDDWRNVDCPVGIGLNDDGSYIDLVPNEDFIDKLSINATNKITSTGSKMVGGKRVRTKTRKRKERRTEKDPNAPKRPANPFFQFCQEQRPIVLDHMITSGTKEPSKQDITKQLAANWNILPRKDKKIYYDKYMKSKELYMANMEQYTMNKAKLKQDIST